MGITVEPASLMELGQQINHHVKVYSSCTVAHAMYWALDAIIIGTGVYTGFISGMSGACSPPPPPQILIAPLPLASGF